MIWSMLKAVPIHHDELISRCDQHLVYLGFGIFLHLQPHPLIKVKVVPIMGHISSDDPNVTRKLVSMAVKQERLDVTAMTTRNQTATAAVGSAAQLDRVEAESKAAPPKVSTKPCPITGNLTDTQPPLIPLQYVLQVNYRQFSVKLVRLSKSEI